MVNLQQPSHREGSRLLLVDSSVLPEVFLRVVEAKRMLAVGQVRSLSEAAKAAGISRSALYKYKDCVFVHNEALDDKVITLSARLEDRPGVLSGLLNSLSEQQGNILTVNQNIPVDGVAAVSVSARLPLPMAIETLRQNLLSLPGVTQVDILSTGELSEIRFFVPAWVLPARGRFFGWEGWRRGKAGGARRANRPRMVWGRRRPAP